MGQEDYWHGTGGHRTQGLINAGDGLQCYSGAMGIED